MAIRIGTPEIDWKDWAKLYNEAVASNREAYQSDWNKMLQGIGLTMTEFDRAKKNAEWNKFLENNKGASFEDMYKERMRINGGF